MKPTKPVSKQDAFQDMENISRTLKRAGDLYRSSRARNGIYDFLHAAYAVYWVLKRRGTLGRQEKLLRLAAKILASFSRRLSELVLLVAAERCDRRARHQRLIHNPRLLVVRKPTTSARTVITSTPAQPSAQAYGQA